MKVAFLLRKFPVLSETFILEQIVGLIDEGVQVDIYALFRGDDSQCHPLAINYRLLERTQFPPLFCSASAIMRVLQSPRLLWASEAKAPLCLHVKSLNIFKYRRQALFLNLFYFASMFDGSQNYEIIHCHFGMYGLLGVDLRDLGLINGKVVTSFHGKDIHVYPKQYGSNVYQRLFSQGDLFTVNSDFTKDCLIKLGCPENKIEKLPVGLRTQQYNNVRPSQKSVDIIQLLTVARLTEKKGIQYSIRAVCELHRKFKDIHYDIVGEGPLQDSLLRLIHDLDADDYIHLVGRCDQVELRQRYAKTDIFILTSVTAANGDMEGQGLVLQEAQASGVPVISTWHNGIPEGILVDESGFLVSERNISELVERLAYLVNHPKQRRKMGNAGQLFVQQYFDIYHLNHQLLRLYNNLL